MTKLNKLDVIGILQEHGAIISGHFRMPWGLHSPMYIQTALVMQYPHLGQKIARALSDKFPGEVNVIVSPAMGAVVIGQEVARQAKSRFIFAEKENNVLVVRRGFTLQPGERVLIVEDVITRGGRVQECLEIVKKLGGTTAGVAVLVDRSQGQARFSVPSVSLLEMSFPTYPADQLPPELAKLPASKPGS